MINGVVVQTQRGTISIDSTLLALEIKLLFNVLSC